MSSKTLRILFIILTMAMNCHCRAARTIDGTVTDSKTGTGISYVTCRALGANDSLLAYTITDDDGHFSIGIGDDARVWNSPSSATQRREWTHEAPPRR